MPARPHDEDPFGEIDRDLQRYSRAFRRHLWVIVVVSLLGGVLGALFLGRGRYVMEQRVALDDSATVLASAGTTFAFAGIPTVRAMRDVLNDSELLETAPQEADVVAVFDPTSATGVVLTVTAGDEAAAKAVSDYLLEALDEFVVNERRTAADEYIAVVSEQTSDVNARLATLDTEIAGLPPDAPLRDGLIDERTSLATLRMSYDASEQAMRAFAASQRRLTIIESQDSSTNTRVLWGIVSLILAFGAAAAATMVIAHFDRRVRSRRDLVSIVDGLVAPAIPASGSERSIALRAVEMAVRQATAGGIVVVPASHRSLAIAQQLASDLGATCKSIDEIGADDEVGTVLAVAADTTHEGDVARVVQYLSALGRAPVCTVLCDVSPRRLREVAV